MKNDALLVLCGCCGFFRCARLSFWVADMNQGDGREREREPFHSPSSIVSSWKTKSATSNLNTCNYNCWFVQSTIIVHHQYYTSGPSHKDRLQPNLRNWIWVKRCTTEIKRGTTETYIYIYKLVSSGIQYSLSLSVYGYRCEPCSLLMFIN